MADWSKTVEIIFGGVDNTGKAISSVGSNLSSLQGQIGSITGPLTDITDSILKVDAALAAAVVGITGYAIKLSSDFNTAFGEIATLIGQPAENLQDFKQQIQAYAETSTASFDQITAATYSAISAGIDYQDSLELIAVAEQLSIAGRADLGDTTRALVSTLNAFGAEASEAGKYADTFFTAVRLGQTTIPELADTMSRLAPIASAAGLSFEEMAAAIATITADTGASTAETITGIRAAIVAMLKPSKDAAGLAYELGLEFDAATLKSKGFAGVMEDVGEATGGNTELIARLFGSVEALSPVLALTGQSAGTFAENLGKFAESAGASETAAKELNIQMGALSQTMVNSIQSALIDFGGNFEQETAGIVQSITGIFQGLGAELRLEDGAFAPLIAQFDGLFQNIEQKLARVRENFPEALSGLEFGGLVDSFGDLGQELDGLLRNLFGDIDLSSVEGLEAVLQRIVDAFTALVQVTAGIAEGLQPLFAAIGAGIEQFEGLDDSAKRTVGELLGFAKGIDTVLPLLGGLGSGLEAVGSGLGLLAGATGFKALISNLDTLKAVGAGVGKYGLLGAALTGGYAIGTLIDDLAGDAIGKKIWDIFGNEDELQAQQAQIDQQIAKIRESAEVNKGYQESMSRLDEIQRQAAEAKDLDIDALQRHANALVEASKAQDGYADEVTRLGEVDVGGSIGKLTQSLTDNRQAALDAAGTVGELAQTNTSLAVSYDESGKKINSFSGTIVKSGEAFDDVAEKTKKAVEESEAFRLKMLEIASDERIAVIESSVDLKIANLEADTERAKALIESIGESIQSTGDLLGSLFGDLSDTTGRDRRDIASQIRKENAQREKAFELQQKLTNAELDQVRARTKALNKGDSLIKIDGQGLQPHLEAFMFEILSQIQVRVNADGREMLLGLGS